MRGRLPANGLIGKLSQINIVAKGCQTSLENIGESERIRIFLATMGTIIGQANGH